MVSVVQPSVHVVGPVVVDSTDGIKVDGPAGAGAEYSWTVSTTVGDSTEGTKLESSGGCEYPWTLLMVEGTDASTEGPCSATVWVAVGAAIGATELVVASDAAPTDLVTVTVLATGVVTSPPPPTFTTG